MSTRGKGRLVSACLLGPDELAQILVVLCGRYLVDVIPGKLRLIATSLPGPAVCAVLPCLSDGTVRVVVDPEKPNAYAHTRTMLREWFESYLAPEISPQGSVSIVRQRAPRHDRLTPLPVALVPETA